LKQFTSDVPLSWQNVYYHFNKLCRDGLWWSVWIGLLRSYQSHLDFSSVQLAGSNTPAKHGRQAIGYQGRKAGKTTNTLFLPDNTAQMLALSELPRVSTMTCIKHGHAPDGFLVFFLKRINKKTKVQTISIFNSITPQLASDRFNS